MESLTGKVALVTGGGRGIGRAVSLALARAGCDVAVNYRERRHDAESAVNEIQKLGRRAIAIQADVSRGADVTELVRSAESELGPIEVLINNAGKILIQPIDHAPAAGDGSSTCRRWRRKRAALLACITPHRKPG
jgi:3-oxoacyl-[acyl-carrier protein] reductase